MYMFLAKHRDRLLEYLTGNGIDAKIHYPIPVHLQKASVDRKEPFNMTDLSVTVRQCKDIITLPVHQHLSEEQINWVVDCIKKFYKEELWK